MKTHHIIFIAATICASLGCSQHEEENGLRPQQPDTKLSIRSIVAEPIAKTRTALDNQRNVVWKSGDRIQVFSAGNPSGAPYATTSDNTRTGIFNPVESSKSVDDAQRYAVYPADALTKGLSGDTFEIELSALAEQSYASALGAGSDIAALPMVAATGDNTFEFKNVCGGLLLRINDYQALGIKIARIEATARGGEQIAGKITVEAATGTPQLNQGTTGTSVTVDCGSGANISSNGDLSKPDGFLVFLPAGTYAQGFSFRITDTEGCRYEIETAQAVTVTAGVVTPLQSLPLTRYYGSANCYRTDASAQTLSIDATPYYTFSQNYVHEEIRCTDASGAPTGIPAKAQVVWQQPAAGASGSVVDAPTMEGATLKVPVTGTKGNAVVAVCKADGTILWSYHIWVSEAQDIACRFEEAGAYTMLDRNLGATSTTPKDRNAYGLFYQWGRKDPFARNLTATRPGGKPYESTPSDLVKTEDATEATGTIAYATRNPQTRLLAAKEWYTGTGGNDLLWGGTAEGSVKTVYDPCPEGYRVPEARHFAEMKFTSKAECDANYGLLLTVDGEDTKSYFPTTGYLEANKAATMYLEYRGYMWLNAGGDAENRFYVNNSTVNIKNEPHAKGMAVRCVKIEQ
ncbi:fimbrillin family protein [Alistipes provencensis]|uniref:fimbrillin family protein n=1 Tax=Alistipes provencensis TaxID=1816676 RepID=UPI0007ECA2BE|nr:fimbrillin family protein [Alistipes provencensis]